MLEWFAPGHGNLHTENQLKITKLGSLGSFAEFDGNSERLSIVYCKASLDRLGDGLTAETTNALQPIEDAALMAALAVPADNS